MYKKSRGKKRDRKTGRNILDNFITIANENYMALNIQNPEKNKSSLLKEQVGSDTFRRKVVWIYWSLKLCCIQTLNIPMFTANLNPNDRLIRSA